MKKNRITGLLIAVVLCLFVFAGCGKAAVEAAPEEQPAAEIVETDDFTEGGEAGCIITFEDSGETFELSVKAPGEEFTLPESTVEAAEGTFMGWIGSDGLHQPGEKAIAEEYGSFTALRSDPNYGTLLTLDPVKGGYSTMGTEGETILEAPYSFGYGDSEDFFDCWTDASGNTFEAGDSVTVEKGDVLILTAVYSTDHSAAYKIEVHFNTGVEGFDEDYSCYVKKGNSVQLSPFMFPDGCRFGGWYDAPEGGSRLATEDPFTPDSDVVLYGHWVAE